MKYIYLLIIIIALASCATTPVMIPDNTKDNIVMMQLKDEIAQEGAAKPSYGWTLWYFPVVIIAFMWAYREFIRKPILCDDGLVKQEKDKDGDGVEDKSN